MIQVIRKWLGRWAWTCASLAIAALVVVPLADILLHIGQDSEGTWQHLTETVLTNYVSNTLLLGGGVAIGTLVIGVPAAWVVTMCRFPGHTIFRWALLLPLAIPTYLLAYAATDLLQFAGPIQTALRGTFNWTRNDYWFPNVRSLPGAIVILTLGLYPYVYLAARSAFLEQSLCVLEVSRTLGVGAWTSFWRVAMPLARPSIAAGLSLALMETFAEFGAVDYCAVDTFATGIYRTWFALGSITAAAQLSACLLAFILFLLLLESVSRRSARFHHTTNRYRQLSPFRLVKWTATLAVIGCALPILLGFVLPTCLFLFKSWHYGDERATETFLELGRNSVILAGIAGVLAMWLALLAAYSRRLQPHRIVQIATRVASLGYAIPGGVIAIGLLGPLLSVELGFNELCEHLFGWTPGFLFTGTILGVLVGYQTRFLAVALNLIQAGLTRIRTSLDDAATTLGASPRRTLVRVHAPLLRGSMLCALLLVFVDALKELPVTLILRPFDFETLAVRVYQLASDERLNEASTGGLAMIVAGLIPVIVLSQLMARARPGKSGSEVIS